MAETTPDVSANNPHTGHGFAYLGATVGAAVSIAANVAHSYLRPDGQPLNWKPETGSVLSAVFWPVALFIAIEVLVRVPWPDAWYWWVIRVLGLVPIAAVAAVVSYRHLSGLLVHYGEDGFTSTFGPIAVDGMMVICSAALIARRMPAAETAAETAPVSGSGPAPELGESVAPVPRAPEPTPVTEVPEPPVDQPASAAVELPAPLPELPHLPPASEFRPRVLPGGKSGETSATSAAPAPLTVTVAAPAIPRVAGRRKYSPEDLARVKAERLATTGREVSDRQARNILAAEAEREGSARARG